ncbi:MAG TPA: hypothetical protein VFX61_07545 [Micromonosporaceae bacterium]|nr:hypothetical protein [Micromonosporaceae bacterium]
MSGLVERLRGIGTALSRFTALPLLVRGGVLLAALSAFLLAYPVEVLTSRAGGLLMFAATLPALRPRGAAPTLAVLLAVAGWLLSVGGYGRPVSLWRLLGLAGVLYLLHSLAALAAALPYDAVVAPEVVAGWVLRALGVVLASAVAAILLLNLAGTGNDAQLMAALGGLAVAVGVAALLARLGRSRPGR